MIMIECQPDCTISSRSSSFQRAAQGPGDFEVNSVPVADHETCREAKAFATGAQERADH